MSANVVLIVLGVVLLVAGLWLAKPGSSQSGGFKLSNFDINIGGTSDQSNNVVPGAAKNLRRTGSASR